MSLPTVQPFDYPDWGAPGVISASFTNFPASVGPSEIILNVPTGYYSHTLLVFNGNGDGESYEVLLRWLTANPIEGGNVVWEQPVVVATGLLVVVPVTNPTQFLQIVDNAATAYPHNVLVTVTLFSAWGSMVGYPGGTWVVNETQSIPTADTGEFPPLGCAPGIHSVNVVTNAATWTLTLRTWQTPTVTVDQVIATNATTQLFDIEFLAPASSWTLIWANTTLLTRSISLLVTRAPT